MIPEHAMVLTAGRGSRLRPYTDTVPKPLVPVGGKPILAHILDRLAAAGVAHVVLNTWYLAVQIEAYAVARSGVPPHLTLSPENDLLDTGGGVARALPLLGREPFVVANGDVIWTDAASGPATVLRLAGAWRDSLDLLLLLVQRDDAVGYDGPGDFDLMDGVPQRRSGSTASHVFTGVRMVHPRLFKNAPDGPFSFNRLIDQALAAGTLGVLEHNGGWFHVSTPGALEEVNGLLLSG